MSFIQIVQFETDNIDELRERGKRYEEEGGGGGGKGTVCADRDNPGRYYIIAQFDSYEAAMENSNKPETQELAADMAKLSNGPPTFYNLDVIDVIG